MEKRTGKTKQSQKGQIIIESLILGFIYFVFLQGILFCTLWVWSKIWVEHHLYETLICLNSPQPSSYCRKNFLKHSRRGLVLFHTKDLKWNMSKTQIQIQLHSAFHTQNTLQKSIRKMALP